MPIMERTTDTITTSYTDVNAVNPVQTLTLSSWDSGDTIKLTYDGAESSAVTFASTATAGFQSAIDEVALLSNDFTYVAGDIVVTRTSATVYVFTFSGSSVQGRAVGAITATSGTGSATGSVAQTAPGQAAKTVTVYGGAPIVEVLKVRAGLFENGATNDISVKDAASRNVWVVTALDTDVSSVKYSAALTVAGQDQAGNTSTIAAPLYESPFTIIVKTNAPASGTVNLYTRGGRPAPPSYRKRSTGTLVTTSGGAATGHINLGSTFADIKRIRITGDSSSATYAITDGFGATVWGKAAVNSSTPFDSAVGVDGVNAAGSAAADNVRTVFKSPLTVAVTSGGDTKSINVTVFTGA